MSKKTYWSNVEYAYNADHIEYGKLKGGAVYVFFFTDDVRKFLHTVEADLLKLHMDVVRVEFVNVYDDEMIWEDEGDTKRYRTISKKAKFTKKVVFDDFYAYM